ncbi:hypothetical protein EYC84_003459 [Monilinia fructicola]|uniref:Uncharacterized protein n=1 Tax=Monilinia fructicola TaxID=38448 RepID=A0A5M9JYV7_MONFR|nr:hypothetical protein EYC84_003459 [Monilinia fructicola]
MPPSSHSPSERTANFTSSRNPSPKAFTRRSSSPSSPSVLDTLGNLQNWGKLKYPAAITVISHCLLSHARSPSPHRPPTPQET